MKQQFTWSCVAKGAYNKSMHLGGTGLMQELEICNMGFKVGVPMKNPVGF